MIKQAITFLLLINIFANKVDAQETCPVIPLPYAYTKSAGTLDINKIEILVANDKKLSSVSKYLLNELKAKTNKTLAVKAAPEKNKKAIILELVAGDKPGYSLVINSDAVQVKSANAEGIFNGINSLLQLVRLSPDGKIEHWQIQDQPGLQWRGLMLDEARHFFGKETVKQLLDWMALYKLNRFHWHLTDEQGWRIEIKKYPKLTIVGGVGNYSNPKAPASYYTQKDIAEIVQYARERFIEIIPEVDMPGHAAASNRAYPEYSGGKSPKRGEYTFNPGKEETYSYLTDILREVKSMFPYGMIHIGGDEVHFGNQPWETDVNVQQLMAKENLKDLKEVEKYFVRRMADSIAKMNTKVLAWDEVTEKQLPSQNTVIFWWRYNHEKRFKQALDEGYQAVLCPQVPFYMDFVQDSTHTVGRRRKGQPNGYNSPERMYGFSLKEFSTDITEQNRHLVLGIQANVWTERTRSKDKLQYMLFPRMATLAEVAWTNSNPEQKNYETFKKRLEGHLELYRQAGLKYYNPLNPETTPEITDRN